MMQAITNEKQAIAFPPLRNSHAGHAFGSDTHHYLHLQEQLLKGQRNPTANAEEMAGTQKVFDTGEPSAVEVEGALTGPALARAIIDEAWTLLAQATEDQIDAGAFFVDALCNVLGVRPSAGPAVTPRQAAPTEAPAMSLLIMG